MDNLPPAISHPIGPSLPSQLGLPSHLTPSQIATPNSTTFDTSAFLSFVSEEIGRFSDDIIDRRSRQVQYLRMYAVALGALLAVAAYALEANRLTTPVERRAYGAFGLLVLVLVFCAGCALTVFLGYNFRGMLIAKKNIAACRGQVHTLLASLGHKVVLCSETRPREVMVSSGMNRTHYWMLWPNAFVAFGSVFFLRYLWGTWQSAVETGAVLIGILAFFYPRVCIAFNRYLRIAAAVSGGWSESRVRRRQREMSAIPYTTRKRDLLVLLYWIVLILIAAAAATNISFRQWGIAVKWQQWILVGIIIAFWANFALRIVQLKVEYLIEAKRRPDRVVGEAGA